MSDKKDEPTEEIKSDQLVVVDSAALGLDATETAEIAAAFSPILEQMVAYEPTYKEIVESEITPAVAKKARELRLKYVKTRSATSDVHKKRKAVFLAGGRYVDGWKNAQAKVADAREEALYAVEDHFDRLERERIAGIAADRTAQLAEYGATALNLGTMEQDTFDALLAGSKLRYEQQVEADRVAEAERVAEAQRQADARAEADREAAAEAARIKEENEQLRLDAAAARADVKAKEDELARLRLPDTGQTSAPGFAIPTYGKSITQELREVEAVVDDAHERLQSLLEGDPRAVYDAGITLGRKEVIDWLRAHGLNNAADGAERYFLGRSTSSF